MKPAFSLEGLEDWRFMHRFASAKVRDRLESLLAEYESRIPAQPESEPAKSSLKSMASYAVREVNRFLRVERRVRYSFHPASDRDDGLLENTLEHIDKECPRQGASLRRMIAAQPSLGRALVTGVLEADNPCYLPSEGQISFEKRKIWIHQNDYAKTHIDTVHEYTHGVQDKFVDEPEGDNFIIATEGLAQGVSLAIASANPALAYQAHEEKLEGIRDAYWWACKHTGSRARLPKDHILPDSEDVSYALGIAAFLLLERRKGTGFYAEMMRSPEPWKQLLRLA